jgi:hypothetical protein
MLHKDYWTYRIENARIQAKMFHSSKLAGEGRSTKLYYYNITAAGRKSIRINFITIISPHICSSTASFW